MASTPVSAEHPRREGLEHQDQPDDLTDVRGDLAADGGQRVSPDQPDRSDPEDHRHEQCRGQAQHPGALGDAPQVHRRQHHEADQADRQQVSGQKRERGTQAGGTGGQTHGDSEDIVDDQARRGEQAGGRAQVLLAHRIRPTPVGVYRDHLPVADDQDAQQSSNDQGDRQGQVQRRGPRSDEDQHDRFRAVRHRAQRV